ncbi:MAG TPA: hypothetical protein VFI82_05025 [Terriglobales bacterium]|jgi:hypothetical protein|nr:hypothetical protein [Terriglobales bacterium]
MNVRRQHVLLALLVAISVFAGWEEFRPRERITPAGQPPLADLQSAERLRRAFNSAHGALRVIVLLSPT